MEEDDIMSARKGTRNTLFNMHFQNENISEKIASYLNVFLPNDNNQPILIVCVGTDRSTGDALGPIIGSMLMEKDNCPFHIYGTLDDPIHAVNLVEKMESIHRKYEKPFIIAVDACLGRMKNIGNIQIIDGPLKPGAGVRKKLPHVGHMHITGIVNMGGFMEFVVLQNTRLSIIMNMAKKIAEGIYTASITNKQKHTLLSIDRNDGKEISSL